MVVLPLKIPVLIVLCFVLAIDVVDLVVVGVKATVLLVVVVVVVAVVLTGAVLEVLAISKAKPGFFCTGRACCCFAG